MELRHATITAGIILIAKGRLYFYSSENNLKAFVNQFTLPYLALERERERERGGGGEKIRPKFGERIFNIK